MHLELATVLSCDDEGCRVTPVAAGPAGAGGLAVASGSAFDTRYSALILNRVKILPGQLVAVNMDPGVPEIAWRWYRTRVVENAGEYITVQERERQLSAVDAYGVEALLHAGDEVWVTGMSGVWEIHDGVVDGKPSNPARLVEDVIPRIALQLSGGG